MYTCPRGHTSTSADYCDECGVAIGAASPPPPAAAPVVTPDFEMTAEPCPDCGAPRTGRFCEDCGLDFLAERSAPTPTATPVSAPPTPPATASGPMRLLVAADRSYHQRMAAASPPDAESIAFPLFCPERRFALDGNTQLLIGRRSRSRGIEPDVDLTGPPEDAGVSHAHALLMYTQEGGWSVVDLDSANGTYLNDGEDPIAPNVPVPVSVGDQIHLGAWTTLTLQSA